MPEKFTIIEMTWIREFLGRLYIPSQEEQEMLVGLVGKLDSVLTKGHTNGSIRQADSYTPSLASLRHPTIVG
jgi:hypothetical protein